MRFLLDTNVVAEWVKPRPAPTVAQWLADVDEDRVFLSAVSIAEISRGIESMSAGRRRERLATWLVEELPARFERRILDIDQRVALAWGAVMAHSRKAGAPISSMDAFFAATAKAHDLTLVTRNVRDFKAAGIRLFDPWQPSA
ncbi:type II toxin-antitoxin system VapC family toxin [bacterium]|nr:MAG: type II toxin-antitoxin system VapC family toxin [bacterium]